jgi:general secretion pathway protein B
MSFILDALKKSEAERQRQAGPTLLEVRVAPPRRRFPIWGMALIALLALNAAVLSWFLWRKPEPSAETAAVTASPVPAAAPAAAARVAPAPVALPSPPAPAAQAVPTPPVASADSEDSTAAAAPSSADTSDTGNAATQNPADLEPAVPASGGHVSVDRSVQNLPSFNDVSDSVPALRLDLHVYSSRPAERYALINMHKVHEGDTLPEGPRVVEINRDGVVLSYQDKQFMLAQ